MYYYGIIFWNEKTDEEVYTYFVASSYFNAEIVSSHYPKGYEWHEGSITFLGKEKPKEYNIHTFDFVNSK